MKITDKFGNTPTPQPVMYLIDNAYVEYKGKDYRFWYQYDTRDGEQTLEFVDADPDVDFDFEGLNDLCQSLVDKEMGEE